jgi:uncharacterized protein YdeI (YjbR/CyaY-like superfamily)
MEIGKTLHAENRDDWRLWLSQNHASSGEIWLFFYKKDSKKKGISYDEAVEEALCFGWIDSTVKKFDTDSRVQRFTPRRIKSELSESNKERIKRMIKSGNMTEAGLTSIKNHLQYIDGVTGKTKIRKFILPADIIESLKKDKEVWQNFEKFPEHYKRIRVSFIDGARKRPEVFKKRLEYFMKMTRKNKRYGMIQ